MTVYVCRLTSAFAVSLFTPEGIIKSCRESMIIRASSQQNLSSGIYDKVILKPVSSASETSYKIEILLVASLEMILSNKPITEALIRLYDAQAGQCLCCWQASKDGFFRVKAHTVLDQIRTLSTSLFIKILYPFLKTV